MSAGLEWLPHCRVTPEGRAMIEAEHHQRERAAAAARAVREPEPALARRLAAAEKRIAQLERSLADRPRSTVIADAIGRALADLHREIDNKTLDPEAVKEAVGAAMAQLHAGIWRAGKGYPQGCLTTHDGSLWLARAGSTGVRPGSGAAAWQLIVKAPQPPSRQKRSTT